MSPWSTMSDGLLISLLRVSIEGQREAMKTQEAALMAAAKEAAKNANMDSYQVIQGLTSFYDLLDEAANRLEAQSKNRNVN